MKTLKLSEDHKKVFKNSMEHRENTNRNTGKNWENAKLTLTVESKDSLLQL